MAGFHEDEAQFGREDFVLLDTVDEDSFMANLKKRWVEMSAEWLTGLSQSQSVLLCMYPVLYVCTCMPCCLLLWWLKINGLATTSWQMVFQFHSSWNAIDSLKNIATTTSSRFLIVATSWSTPPLSHWGVILQSFWIGDNLTIIHLLLTGSSGDSTEIIIYPLR